MPGLGYAYLYSESNKKCRASVHNITVCIFMDIPEKLKKKKEKWKKRFGTLPNDLQFGCHKY